MAKKNSRNPGFVYEVESGIVIPAKGAATSMRRDEVLPDPPLYPFANLEVGDSFFVEKPVNQTLTQVANRASVSICDYRRTQKKSKKQKHSLRTYKDGVRVWRTA